MSVVNFDIESYVDQSAPLVELVDTQDSKSCSGDRVRVRFSRGAPFIILLYSLLYSRFKKGKKAKVYAGYRTRLLNSKSSSRKGVSVRFRLGAPFTDFHVRKRFVHIVFEGSKTLVHSRLRSALNVFKIILFI